MSYHVCKIQPCLMGQPVFKLTKVFRVYVPYSETWLPCLSLFVNIVFSLKTTILGVLYRDK